MKRIVLALLAALAAGPSFAQVTVVSPLSNVQSTSGGFAADDTDIALLVKYVGTGASGLVAVAAGGDLTFTEGAEGTEAATATFECPVSGALGGVIDVSDTACDTLGEVCDVINGNTGGTATTATNWRCVILDGLRTDSSNDTLNALSATAATADDGLGLKWDTSVAFKASFKLGAPRKIGAYFDRTGSNPLFRPNPFGGTKTMLARFNGTSTYGSGTSTLELYSVVPTLRAGRKGSEEVRTLYTTPGGATTVNKEVVDDFISDPNGAILVRINNSAAASVVTLYAYGVTFNFP